MENNKKNIPVFYTTVPNLLIQARFLNRIERELVILFASQIDGCSWSKIALREYCECGPYHLERAIKRLQLWKLIKVIRGKWKTIPMGKRRENNRYIFEKNPYKWKLTPELQEKILDQTLTMKMQPQAFEEEPYPNFTGFEVVFAKINPKYAKGKKGRRTEKENEKEIEIKPNKWIERTEKILSQEYSFLKLACDYFSYFSDIEIARNTTENDFSESQKNYLLKLHDIYTNKRRNPRSEDDFELVKMILDFEQENMEPINISLSLYKHGKGRKI